MTREEAKKRRSLIVGTPLNTVFKNRVDVRKIAHSIPLEYDLPDPNIAESFFEFDDELVEAESARRLFEITEENKIREERQAELNRLKKLEEEKKLLAAQAPIVINIPEEQIITEPFIFQEIFESEIKEQKDEPSFLNNEKNNNKSFEFKYCAFIKDDGSQCRRQAPKNDQYCSSHRKK